MGLHKESYIVPITIQVKMLPSLEDGIRMVSFIAKHNEDLEGDETLKTVNYLLYREDTEQVVGVT